MSRLPGGGLLSAKVTKYYILLSAWLEPVPLSYFAPRNRMAHKASPITILNDDRIGTNYAYNDTTLPSGPLSMSPEAAAGLSASFQSASWSSTAAYGQGLGFTPYFQSSGSAGRFPADGETVAIPEGCREAFRKFAPWNNPQNVISAHTTDLLESVVYCGVLPLLCVLGLFTNFLSCAVFYR